MKQFDVRRWVLGALLGACCVIVGASLPTMNQARGEVRGTAEAPTFSTGAVPLLRDISVTLRQMDRRLERLEALGQKLQASAAARTAEPPEESN